MVYAQFNSRSTVALEQKTLEIRDPMILKKVLKMKAKPFSINEISVLKPQPECPLETFKTRNFPYFTRCWSAVCPLFACPIYLISFHFHFKTSVVTKYQTEWR